MEKRICFVLGMVLVYFAPLVLKAQADTAGVTVNNVSCFGGNNGSVLYSITGGPGPVKYSWSNGKSGYATGSCTYAVTLNNPGSALSQFQVNVNIKLAPGIDSSFSNVVFIDSAGNNYPFWLTDFPTDSSASFWVRVPVIPPGVSVFYLSFCGNDSVSHSNPFTTFEFFDGFDSSNLANYTGACFNIDQGGESCGQNVSNGPVFSPPYSLYLTGNSSCFSPPYDGAGSTVTRTIPLVNDSLVFDYEDMTAVTLWGFCQGGTSTTNTVIVDSINLGNGASVGQGGSCATNTTPWKPETSLPFSVTNGQATFTLQTYGGDCDNSQAWWDDVRVRKYRANPPVVTVSATPQLALDSLTAGSYTLTMISLNGDTSKVTVVVTQPGAIQLTVSSGGILCTGTSPGFADVRVNGGAQPFTYNWSNTQTTDTASNLANGNYTVTVTDAHHCSTSTSVSVQLQPVLQVAITTDSASCGLANGAAYLLATGGLTPYSYAWQPAVTTSASDTTLLPGHFAITVTDSGGCTVSDTFDIYGKNFTLTRPNLGADTSICVGTEKLVLNAGSFLNYLWQDGSTHQSLTVADSGTYWVVVTDSNTCKASDTILVTNYCNTSFVVPSAFTPNGDGKNDVLLPLYIDAPASFGMHLYNRWGELLFESNEVTLGWDGKFKGKEQPPGTYVYYIHYNYPGQKEQTKEGAVELLR